MHLYKEAIKHYYDLDGLVGDPRYIGLDAVASSRWSGGNQLLETFTDLVIQKKLGCLTQDDLYRVSNAVTMCQPNGQKGIYDKNPPHPEKGRRLDYISWDDIWGVALGSKILGLPFAREILEFMRSHDNLMLNVPLKWWELHKQVAFRAGPRSRAVYQAAGDGELYSCTLSWIIKANISSEKEECSGRRLVWLLTEALQGMDRDLDETIYDWRAHIKNMYGGIKGVFAIYHGENHPFAKFMEEGSV